MSCPPQRLAGKVGVARLGSQVFLYLEMPEMEF